MGEYFLKQADVNEKEIQLIESDSLTADSIDSRTPARSCRAFLASVTNSIGLDERDRDEILLNLKVLSSTIRPAAIQTSRLRAYSRTAYSDLIAKITAPTPIHSQALAAETNS